MANGHLKLLAVVFAATALAIALVCARRDHPAATADLQTPATQKAVEAAAVTSPTLSLPAKPPRASSAQSSAAVADPVVAVGDALLALQRGPDTATARTILARLREQLRSASGDIAAQAVVDFLAGGGDAPTGLPFEVGPEGVLAGEPTLRVALMDVLPALDPEAALAIARIAMDAHNSSEEYAISLRNLAWNDFEGDMRAELAARFKAMLSLAVWRTQPSTAFLESFDVAVHTGDEQSVDTLAQVITLPPTNNATRAVNRAAFIALDRIALRDPAMLVAVQAHPPASLVAQPDLRASLLSRLDITNDEQRAAFSAYLADPTVSAAERSYFAELFPNGNYTHGDRLVTTPEATPSIADRATLDARIEKELANLAGATAAGQVADTIAHIRARLSAYHRAPP